MLCGLWSQALCCWMMACLILWVFVFTYNGSCDPVSFVPAWSSVPMFISANRCTPCFFPSIVVPPFLTANRCTPVSYRQSLYPCFLPPIVFPPSLVDGLFYCIIHPPHQTMACSTKSPPLSSLTNWPSSPILHRQNFSAFLNHSLFVFFPPMILIFILPCGDSPAHLHIIVQVGWCKPS